ncbi:hypothetical protein SELMODRAFT_88462 [Selaginella moellendorffii]|uniref:Methyltransferase-like protein 23 n=1 Tax=Selaginella moellendorffii TaxID=88036 RepID=D8R9T9_SELML|nr:methyltransferase-like protein 23 [Selaginella moellendorffii]EFJ30953.1 hypothetical protein SELMODRAFT_88462 [Selaginella moellendorffii]|eukprot:XP_002967606.1 methyltransferase-like protein 23 [Selaginella moellendorffii]
MRTVSEHRFDGEGGDSLAVSISEVMKEDYGLYVWPCGICLGEYVWQQRHRFAGSTVIELGAGTGLPGIVAAKVGARVILTDYKLYPEVFENMRKTCDLNNVECEIQGLTWGEWDENLLAMKHPRFVLGADVLYDSKDFDDLFATVSYFLANNPDATFITSYECRSGHRSIEFFMGKWKLCCTKLVDVCDILPPLKQCAISSSILIAEIKSLV